MFLIFFSFLDPYYVCSQDIQLEGVLSFGDSLLNQLRSNIDVQMTQENDEESSLENKNSWFIRRMKKSGISGKMDSRRDKDSNFKVTPVNRVVSNESDTSLNIESNKVDGKRADDENSAKEIDSSHKSERTEKQLDTNKPVETILIGKPLISTVNVSAEKSKKKHNPKISNKHLSLRTDTKDTGLKNHTLKSTHNSATHKMNNKNHQHKMNDNFGEIKKSDHVNIASNNEYIHTKEDGINKHKRNQTIRGKNEKIQRASEETSETNRRVKRFFEHIIYDQVKDIERIGNFLQEKLGLDRSVFLSLLNASCDSYTLKMKHYVNFIKNHKTNCDIDKEYLYLDIVASANMVLYSEERKLLNQMIDKKKSNVTLSELESLTEEIYKESVNQKKKEMFFICQELQVCRTYPGFSDYFAELTSEILKLPDKKLEVIVNITAKLIKNRIHFFKALMKSYIADMIGKKLETLSKDLYYLKETFSVVRSIIVQRFKMMQTNDDLLRNRTKAVRILIDMIDKTFSSVGDEELTVMTFDTAVQGIRKWALGKRDKIDIPLKLLFDQVVGVLSHNWQEDVTDEVKMLTEVMMTGKTDMTVMFNEIFKRGSPFFRSFPIF